jgi:hypothetical protein
MGKQKTVGWHWRVMGDAGYGYFELLESLWVSSGKKHFDQHWQASGTQGLGVGGEGMFKNRQN